MDWDGRPTRVHYPVRPRSLSSHHHHRPRLGEVSIRKQASSPTRQHLTETSAGPAPGLLAGRTLGRSACCTVAARALSGRLPVITAPSSALPLGHFAFSACRDLSADAPRRVWSALYVCPTSGTHQGAARRRHTPEPTHVHPIESDRTHPHSHSHARTHTLTRTLARTHACTHACTHPPTFST